MDSPRKFPPREGDLDRDELLRRANLAFEDSGVPVDVWFKYTCEHCGERCTFQEPNMLYENGECHKCGKTTVVKVGGFCLHYKFGLAKAQRNN